MAAERVALVAGAGPLGPESRVSDSQASPMAWPDSTAVYGSRSWFAPL